MAKPNARVFIPRNPTDLIKLAKGVYAKHQSDGDDSPLNGLEDDNWTDNGAKVAQAELLDEQAKQMQKDLENLFKQRDMLVASIDATVKASRDLLLGKFSKNPKKLGDWTFVVDDSPRAKDNDQKAA